MKNETIYKDFSNTEILFLKKIIEIVKHANIQADAFIGEPDIRILEPYDVDRFSFTWWIGDSASLTIDTNTVFVPIKSRERHDYAILNNAYAILSAMTNVIVLKKSPVLGRLNKLIYSGYTGESDLKANCILLFNTLLESYQIVDSAWDTINGEFVCNHGMLNYNRIYKGEYAYSAEELYSILRPK
jgi:hypothetical protein